MIGGWGAFAGLGVGVSSPKTPPPAEPVILEGKGVCALCGEEIIRNSRGIWESDFLLEYCACSTERSGQHKPIVKWTAETGVAAVPVVEEEVEAFSGYGFG